MKRAPLAHPQAPQVMMELPTLRDLHFAPLPYQTHPIDLYDGPQGWGPFYGPWTPWDFRDPAASIAYTYGHGESNDWQFAPPYDVITVFADPSLNWAGNTSYDIAMQNAQNEQQTAQSSTIANVVPKTSSFLSKLRDVLLNSSDEGG